MAIALMAALLAACGFGKKIYEDDRLNAMITEADGSETVSIRAAEVPETVTGAGLRVSWGAYLHHGTEAGSATSSLSDVTEDVIYESYTSTQGFSMELFVDEGSGQALVLLLEDGAYYTWSLNGELTMDSVKTFADTIAL